MNAFLETILARTRETLEARRRLRPLSEMMRAAFAARPPADFAAALSTGENFRVIAELKKASPSLGLIRADFNPVSLARGLERAGAAALSVLTEPHYFLGDIRFLSEVSAAVSLPILRKDFIVDPYQICEARACGASAVLLIAAALDTATLRRLRQCAEDFGMCALCEAHTPEELARVLESGARVAGINRRDLNTFTVSSENTAALLKKIPDGVVRVVESGVKTRADLARLVACGADAFLAGTTLMRAADPAETLKHLIA